MDGKVYFAHDDEIRPGDFVMVKVLDCDEYDLTGAVTGIHDPGKDSYEYSE